MSTSPISPQNWRRGLPDAWSAEPPAGSLYSFLFIVILKSPATITGTPALSMTNSISSHRIYVLNRGGGAYTLATTYSLDSGKTEIHTALWCLLFFVCRRTPYQSQPLHSLPLNGMCEWNGIAPSISCVLIH